MHVALAALFFFAILTLWVPGYWPVAIFQVGIFVLAGIALWRSRRAFPRFSYPLFPLLAAVACGLLQLAAGKTVYAFDTQSAIVRWLTFLAVFVAGSAMFREARVASWFRDAMLWFTFLVAIAATVQAFTTTKILWLFDPPYNGDTRISGMMGPILNYNHFAAFVEVVLPMAIYGAMRSRSKSLLYSGMAAVMYASVIASTSRAGTILASTEILVVPVLLWARGLAKGGAVGAAFMRMAVLFAVFVAVVGWEHVRDRLLAPDPMAVRRELATSTTRMIADHPWYGVGLGAWPAAYPRYAVLDVGLIANQAHSDWLQWTAEGGIPLGIILVTLFGWCIVPAVRTVWGVGVVIFFVHAAVEFPFSRPALGSWAFVVVAMLAAQKAGREQLAAGGGR